MKFDIAFERIYPYPREVVWRVMTDRKALGQWLMETDFVAEKGRSFQMWCENPEGKTDRYLCKVLSIEAPERMLWSWLLEGRESEGETYVEFELADVPEGTCLTVRHSGDRDERTIDAFKSGWPSKLETLDSLLHSE